jgi:invasion protein IalB
MTQSLIQAFPKTSSFASTSAFPRRLARAASVVALASALVLTLLAEARAQQKAQTPKPAPKGQAQQAQPAQPAPAPAPEIPPLVYSHWTKLCSTNAEAGGRTMCRIGKDGRLDSGTPMVGAVLMEVEGDARKILQIMLPLGILLPRGTRVRVDSDEQGALVLPIIVCAGGGCMAQAEASADMVAKLKKGQNLYVQAYNMQQSVFTLAVPLADFAKAYDGPATDPKDMEDRNKKLQEQLQKRGEQLKQQQK